MAFKACTIYKRAHVLIDCKSIIYQEKQVFSKVKTEE